MLTETDIKQTVAFLCKAVFDAAHNTAREIQGQLNKSNEGVFKSIVRIFSKGDENAQSELIKLKFALSISFLAAGIILLELSDRCNAQARTILDKTMERFHGELNKIAKGKLEYISGEFIISNEMEKQLIIAELCQMEQFANIQGLPRMDLSTIADFVLEKRINEYVPLLLSDFERMSKAGFIATSPQRVYRDWTGQESQNWEALTFNMILFNRLIEFSKKVGRLL